MIRKSISITNRKCTKFTSLSATCNSIDRCLLPHCYRRRSLNRANIIPSTRSISSSSRSGSSGILTSLFSTNPSYDDIDDDLDNDVETTTWIKRSPGINNLSSTHYNNANSGNSGSYYQYEVSRPSPPSRKGLSRDYTDRKQYDVEEDGSLLNLLNNDTTIQHQQQSRLDLSQQDRYDRIEEVEGSLLNLLNTSQSNSTYTTPISPRHYMPRNNDGEDNEHDKINSLLGLLGGKSSIDEKGVDDNDNRQEGGEGSLLNLLGSESEDESVSDELLLYPALNGYQQQQQQQQQQIEDDDDSSMLDLLASPPSTSTTTSTSNTTKCYKHLQSLQLQLEIESLTQTTTKQLEIYNSARDRSDYNTIPVVKRALDDWYKELNEVIEIEQWLYLNGDNNTQSDVGLLNTNDDNDTYTNDEEEETQTTKQRKVRDRSIYGPLLCLLPSRKLSVIVANSVLSASLSDKHGYIKVVQLALLISNAIEMEVNVSRALRVKAKERKIALVGNEEENENEILLGDEEDDTPLNIDHRTIAGTSKKRVSIKPFNMNEAEAQAADNKKSEGEGIVIDNYIYTATHLQRFLDELPGNSNNTDNSGGNNQKSLKNIGQIRPEKVRRRCKEILLAEEFDMNNSREEEVDNYSTTTKENMNDFVEWDPVQKVKLGCALIQLLLDNTTFTKPTKDSKQQRHGHTEPAFQYKRKMMGNKNGKAHGVIEIHPELHNIAVNEEFTSTSMYISPSLANSRVQPMVVPPNDWLGVNDGGYETIKVPFMRTRHCKTQKVSTRRN